MAPHGIWSTLPAKMHDDCVGSPVKNTFIHFDNFVQGPYDGNTLRRQESEPAPSMQQQHLTRACKLASVGEPEAEPDDFARYDGFCRQMSELSVGSFCRQETDHQWPAYTAPGIDNPAEQFRTTTFATFEHTTDSVSWLPSQSPPCRHWADYDIDQAYPNVGKKESPTTCDEVDPKQLDVKGRKRKSRSLITLAQKAQLRNQRQEGPKSSSRQKAEQAVVSAERNPAGSTSQQAQRAKFCPFCGGAVQQDFKFCRFCGTSVSELIKR